MKLLLDENLPHKLRLEIQGHEVFTTAYMGWSGIENGELLKLAAQNGFDALITNDRGMEYEQGPAKLPIAVIVLGSKRNTIESIRLLYSRMQDALKALKPGEFVRINE